MLNSIIKTTDAVSYSTNEIIICSITALILGFVIACVFYFIGENSKSYITTLVILPLLICSIIMMVNGNLGTSVAVLGSFGLIRFRSQPGNAKEIAGVFFAMTVGVSTAMGCIAFAIILTIVVSIIFIIAGNKKFLYGNEKILKITIPENLDYTNVFDDILEEFTKKSELLDVKTTNMGSMFDLKYKIVIKSGVNEKEMIDKIRCKNGNLTVMCSRNLHINDSL